MRANTGCRPIFSGRYSTPHWTGLPHWTRCTGFSLGLTFLAWCRMDVYFADLRLIVPLLTWILAAPEQAFHGQCHWYAFSTCSLRTPVHWHSGFCAQELKTPPPHSPTVASAPHLPPDFCYAAAAYATGARTRWVGAYCSDSTYFYL